MTADDRRVAVDRLHPVRVQLRRRRAGRRPQARQDPRRQGASRVAGLHLQQGAAARPLPEQPQPADVAAAPARRRQLRGDRLGHRDFRDRRGLREAIRDEHGGDKIFYYGGGGQGNHLGGAYSGAFLKAIGSRYRSNALAQEKTGEHWVDAHFYGGHTRGEFEHAEVSVFIGKNPWMSQSFPRARVVLNEIAKDPARSMIVIDPVITDTAKLADFHLRVRPGADAWCLAALAAVLVQEELCDEQFLAEHVTGVGRRPRGARATSRSPTTRNAAASTRTLLRAAARRIAARGKRVRVRGPRHPAGAEQHAVLVSEQAAVDPHRQLRQTRCPAPAFVVRAAVRGGRRRPHARDRRADHRRVWCRRNVVPRGDPDRPSRPVPGDDRREQQPGALGRRLGRGCARRCESLELLVVIDVAMTETARLAHYVLPAASQFEKPEATFFNLEFPHNTFHLRHPLMEPLPGTWPSPRSGRGWCAPSAWSTTRTCGRCAARPREGLDAYAAAFLTAVGANPGAGPGAAVRALRDAGPGPARGAGRRGSAVGAGPEDGDGLPGCGARAPATPTATPCSRRSWRAGRA